VEEFRVTMIMREETGFWVARNPVSSRMTMDTARVGWRPPQPELSAGQVDAEPNGNSGRHSRTAVISTTLAGVYGSLAMMPRSSASSATS
jgi:hypothetical protein